MEDNGILARVPGQFVAQASHILPPPELADDGEHQAEIDAGHAGRVRIYYKRQRAKRGKHSHWFWVAVRAEPA
ncbi:hypothetical protein [Bordetella sp. 15P40C-2]|uniref:hypothetical protein n=1 Tax=Bordetella sp. 15P40C-2 TaxID=2572246 RepID=UPI001321A335|nr:hypothetical protein [Bordetella sp. 15P40C-2]MVW72118.1 hypothetical protein [Bordetella sp. 15P40C-2]